MCKHQELVNINENANKISGTKSGLMQLKGLGSKNSSKVFDNCYCNICLKRLSHCRKMYYNELRKDWIWGFVERLANGLVFLSVQCNLA